MKTPLAVLALCLAALLPAQTPPGSPVRPAGSPCEQGTSPAATLLVPYFEVSSRPEGGMDTLVAVTNTGEAPIVAHGVVWNVDGWAVFAFNIFLTGYDVATFSMRQVLVHGKMPNNGCASATHRFTTLHIDCDGDGTYFGQEWTRNDGMFSSPFGPYDIACYEPVSAVTLADWQCKLSTGSYDGWNSDFVGYLTIDAALTCAYGLPDYLPIPYFRTDYLDTDGDGRPDHGILENTNVLMGDIFYLDPATNQSDGVGAVHIEAWGEENSLPGHTWGSRPAEWALRGVNTFYYKYEALAGLPPNDAREPLPTVWAFRYFGYPAFDGRTYVDVWRSHNPTWERWIVPDPNYDGLCSWFDTPMGWTTFFNPFVASYHQSIGLARPEVRVWDENGWEYPRRSPYGFDNLYLAAQRVDVSTGEGWPLVDDSGWIQLDFRTDQRYSQYIGSGFGHTFDQAWINVRYRAHNKYSVSVQAVPVTGGCAFVHDDATGMYILQPTH